MKYENLWIGLGVLAVILMLVQTGLIFWWWSRRSKTVDIGLVKIDRLDLLQKELEKLRCIAQQFTGLSGDSKDEKQRSDFQGFIQALKDLVPLIQKDSSLEHVEINKVIE